MLARFGNLAGRSYQWFLRRAGRRRPFPETKAQIAGAGNSIVGSCYAGTSRRVRAAGVGFVNGPPPASGALNVTGRNFVYDYKTNSFVVTGDAVVTQQATILTADEIDLARGKRELHAKGRVHLVDPLSEIRAREGRLNLPDETADLTDATISNYNRTIRLEGARVQKFPGQRYSVLDGVYTTCGPRSPARRTGASRPIRWMFIWATPPPRTMRTLTFSATRCCTRHTRFFRPIPAAIRGF